MSEDRAREYAEWYVWAKRNLSATPEICHAAAQAAAEANQGRQDAQAAARAAAQSRTGPGWSSPAAPPVRQYAEWYDWARTELGAAGDDLARATSAATTVLHGGGDAATAANAARAAIGKAEPARSPTPNVSAPPPPSLVGAQPAYGGLPPPPPPPGGYAAVAPPAWSPGAYPAYPAGLSSGYAYPGSTGTDGYAIASLVCSIIGLPAVFCYGIPAIALGLVGFFLGRSALKRIQASGGYKSGRGIATAGWIVGIIAAVLGLLVVIFYIVIFAAAFTGALQQPTPAPTA
ncbi:MAG: DUF4190 domain-containing protein [Candidatus Dormibacteraeota bacterium]|nr:DUF4190 domain-containing protein [Candidatus Dormibacteraeota bacterium]